MFPGLSIVIVNWNLKEDTLACIDSLVAAGASPEQIILVDNGSTDGSVLAFRSRYGIGLQLVENQENFGFAQGSNQGIQIALDRGAEWILLLNNDTVVAPDFLHTILEAAKATDSFAILAPLIFYHADPDRIWYLGDHLISGTLITANPYRGKVYHHRLPDLLPVDFASGCAMLVNRAVFDRIGLFDPKLVMYGEEVDFCWRARLAGFRIAAATRAKIWHKVSLSADRDKPRTRYLRIRNQIWFYRKYARGFQRPLMFLFTILRSVLIGLSDLYKRQATLISPLFKGWRDGWLSS